MPHDPPRPINPLSVLSRVTRADVRHEPFPHVTIDDAIEPERFAALRDAFPSLDVVAQGAEPRSNYAYLISYDTVIAEERIAPIWREFFDYHTSPAFYADFIALFGDEMRRLYPELEPFFGMRLEDLPVTNRSRQTEAADTKAGDAGFQVELDCQFGINSPVREPTSVRGPHVDSRYKFFNALCYFRDPEDHTEGGDLQLYRFRDGRPVFDGKQPDPADLEPMELVPYRANRLIIWVNSPHALHGVTVRQRTEYGRRYVNFAGECYRLPNDQLFARPQKRSRALRRAAGLLASGDFGALAGAVKRRLGAGR